MAIAPEVASELNFPPGSSGSGVLFRSHPYDETLYIRAAEYNAYILKEKIAELARVLISAGATSFEITANTASTAKLVLDATTMLGGGSFKAARRGATKVAWSYTGTGQNIGTLPDDLRWFNHQEDWQAMWESAVHYGAESHTLEIFQNMNHELSGMLAAKFEGAGFNLGGRFCDTSSSRLKVKVSFSTK
jgi:hypothetical protein